MAFTKPKRTKGLTDDDDDASRPISGRSPKPFLDRKPAAIDKDNMVNELDASTSEVVSVKELAAVDKENIENEKEASEPAKACSVEARATIPTSTMNATENANENANEKAKDGLFHTGATSPGAVPVTVSDHLETNIPKAQYDVHTTPSTSLDVNNVPGAIPVEGKKSLEVNDGPPSFGDVSQKSSAIGDKEDNKTVVTEGAIMDPVVAELAPDVDEVAARVAQQLEEQLASEWARLRQEAQKSQPQVGVLVQGISIPEGESTVSPGEGQKSLENEKDDGYICGLKTRTCGILVVLLLVVGGAVGGALAAVLSGGRGGDPVAYTDVVTVAPTSAPTPEMTLSPTETPNPKREYLMEVLGNEVGTTFNATDDWWASLDDPLSPQGQALTWMSEEDVFSDNPESVASQVLVERFALAVLYYSTSGPNWLLEFPFLDSSLNACDWNNGGAIGDEDSNGVYCSDSSNFGVVTYMDFHELRLSGSLPWEICLLDSTFALYMEYNSLSGTIPTQIGHLSQLLFLWMHSNALSGQIPPYLPSPLLTLRLTDNYLSGSLASEWATSIPNIQRLQLGLNRIHGTIPSELANLSELYWLDMEGSKLSGTIPTELGLMSSMKYMYFEMNDLTGTLPSEIGTISLLEHFFVYGNEGITGTVPTEFANLTSLYYFSFADTSLTGSVDDFLCVDGGGPLFLEGDCLDAFPEIECSCCTKCCSADASTCETM